jgi:hypothetical protein
MPASPRKEMACVPDPSLPSGLAGSCRNACRNRIVQLHEPDPGRKHFMEVDAVRNVLRILIVLSAIMGLLAVQRVGWTAGVVSGARRHSLSGS